MPTHSFVNMGEILMQCSCGGDATGEVNEFKAEDHEKCLKEAFPHKPTHYPCVVHRNGCDACGRQSVHITYNLGGIICNDGKIIPGWETQPPPKTKVTKRLF